MTVDAAGLAVTIVLYVIILVFDIIIARWHDKKHPGSIDDADAFLVAHRKIGPVVGIFTMTATLCGGGFLNGTAESIASYGLAWTVFPFAICVGSMIGGLVYARPMRERRYTTMMDPLQDQYTTFMVCLNVIGSLAGDIFWSASILGALGSSLSVIIDLDMQIGIWVSAAIAVVYTGFGKLVSVAYSDVIQLAIMAIGLFLCLPWVLTNSAVTNISETFTERWAGSIPRNSIVSWIDLAIAMMLGTIPWNIYFQRVLSVEKPAHAQYLSFAGGLGALIFTIPPVLIGAAGVSADWNDTAYGRDPVAEGNEVIILPLVVNYLTPRPVTIIALAALSAAVMSSIDSAVLSSSSLFTHNIYKVGIRPKARKMELSIVQFAAVIVAGVTSSLLAIYVNTINGLFVVAGDIVFVIVFPQLTAAIFCRWVNGYGSLVGFILGVILRVGAGDGYLNFEPFIKYPYYTNIDGQLFPFRTFAMLCNLLAVFIVSYLMRILFAKNILPSRLDIFDCMRNRRGPSLCNSENEDAKDKSGWMSSQNNGYITDEMALSGTSGSFVQIYKDLQRFTKIAINMQVDGKGKEALSP